MKSPLKKEILFSLFIFFIACKQNAYQQGNTLVPYTRVAATIYSNNISFPGSFKVLPQGKNGIIVFNVDGINFRAFDLGCPYIGTTTCSKPMSVDNTSGEMKCDNCAKDDITFTQYKTNVTINNKTYYLREYKAYLEGDILNGVVRITNF